MSSLPSRGKTTMHLFPGSFDLFPDFDSFPDFDLFPDFDSFPDSGWEQFKGGSANEATYLRQSLITGVPSLGLGTRKQFKGGSANEATYLRQSLITGVPSLGLGTRKGGSANEATYLRQSLITGVPSLRLGTRMYVLLLSGLVISLTNIPAASAHKVKTAADVGATLHIEPNDTPRAGEAAPIWFALRRKSGDVIPLTQCNCQLAVYAEPRKPGETPLLTPALQPVAAERYQGVPGAEITFPKPGAYQLQLTGKPVSGASFQPFELKFDVTVATGTTAAPKTQEVQNVNKNVVPPPAAGLPLWAIALPALAVIGVIFAVVQGRKRS